MTKLKMIILAMVALVATNCMLEKTYTGSKHPDSGVYGDTISVKLLHKVAIMTTPSTTTKSDSVIVVNKVKLFVGNKQGHKVLSVSAKTYKTSQKAKTLSQAGVDSILYPRLTSIVFPLAMSGLKETVADSIVVLDNKGVLDTLLGADTTYTWQNFIGNAGSNRLIIILPKSGKKAAAAKVDSIVIPKGTERDTLWKQGNTEYAVYFVNVVFTVKIEIGHKPKIGGGFRPRIDRNIYYIATVTGHVGSGPLVTVVDSHGAKHVLTKKAAVSIAQKGLPALKSVTVEGMNVQFTIPASENGTLNVYDLSGTRLHRGNIENGSYSWDRSSVNAGNYLVRVKTNKGSYAQTISLK